MLVPALPKPPGWLRALCSAVLVPYNNTPKLRQVSLKLLQLAANLRDWLDLEGIISYYGWPGKAPVAFTLTLIKIVIEMLVKTWKCRLVNHALQLGKEKRVSLGESQLRGRIGKSLYFLFQAASCFWKSSKEKNLCTA